METNPGENMSEGKHLHSLVVPSVFLSQAPKLVGCWDPETLSGACFSLVCLCKQACLSSTPLLFISVSYQWAEKCTL